MADTKSLPSNDLVARLGPLKLELSQIVSATTEIQDRILHNAQIEPTAFNRKGEVKVSVIDWQRVRGKVIRLKTRAKRCREDLSACIGILGIPQK